MSYEVINEELKIAKCSIAGLTMEQVEGFLKLWNDDSAIGTLTMFYDRKSEMLVLNADNKMYEDYLQIATAYLGGDYEKRKELWRNAPDGIGESMKLLRKTYKYRIFDRRTFQARNNSLEPAQREYIESLIDERGPHVAAYIAFKAGIISGKRAERKKRKQVQANA